MKQREWNFEEEETEEDGFVGVLFQAICLGLMFWIITILGFVIV